MTRRREVEPQKPMSVAFQIVLSTVARGGKEFEQFSASFPSMVVGTKVRSAITWSNGVQMDAFEFCFQNTGGWLSHIGSAY